MNYQLTFVCFVLLSTFQALTSFLIKSRAGILSAKHCLLSTLSSISATFSQRPMLRRMVDLKAFRQAQSLLWKDTRKRLGIFVDGSSLSGSIGKLNIKVRDYEVRYQHIFKEAASVWSKNFLEPCAKPDCQLQRTWRCGSGCRCRHDGGRLGRHRWRRKQASSCPRLGCAYRGGRGLAQERSGADSREMSLGGMITSRSGLSGLAQRSSSNSKALRPIS